MKNKKIYYYPSSPRNGYGNPYSLNVKKALEEYFEVLDADNKPCAASSLGLLKQCFKADIYVLNWIEGVGFLKFPYLQFLLVLLSLLVIRLRGAKISWTFHNIHPHRGENFFSRFIGKYLFGHADLIVCHSKDARDYAMQFAKCDVLYICHPLSAINIDADVEEYEPVDLLIWGDILPYKGVPELLESRAIRDSNLKITIIGKCSDTKLSQRILSSLTSNIIFENRRIDFQELHDRIRKSKYVIFPYIGDSVSSSGALMDTISLGGIPLGPDVGAFKDLAKEGVCLTYMEYRDIVDLVTNNHRLEDKTRKEFIKNNSWSHFAEQLYNNSSLKI